MLNKPLLARLALDLTSASLLLLALAYYLWDNLVHELLGTGMFLLVIAHNLVNRKRYPSLAKPAQEPRRLVDIVLLACLLGGILTLLATSLFISQSVFSAIALPDAFIARRVHAAAAYWVLLLVAIHLGIRWRMILAAARMALGTRKEGTAWATALRLVSVVIAAVGLHGWSEIGVGSKLLARVALEWWDFGASTAGFFVHHVAIAGLFIVLAHYAFRWLASRRRPIAGA
jgi:hypothetical protein